MSDDVNKKIKQITDILGQENMPDNIKNLISMLSNPSKNESSKESEHNERSSEKNEPNENHENTSRTKNLFDNFINFNDPRLNLINAIKPFLNNSRQKKVQNCIKIIQMASMYKMVDDHEK